MWAAVTEAAGEDGSIMIAALAVIATLAGAIVLLVKIYNESRAANQAVNNVGPGEHSLYDSVQYLREDVSVLVEAQRQFAEKGWPSLPDDLSTSAALTETIRNLQHGMEQNAKDHAEIMKHLGQVQDFMRAHDHWERYERPDEV